MSSSRKRNPSLQPPLVAAPSVPGYRVTSLIGEGGFGQVWKGQRESDGELVAIKFLHLELVRSTDAMVRFARELDAIKQIRHRSVVMALDHGTIDARPYIVLEYIEGKGLRDLISERRALPPADMLAILEPICEALAVAHAAGYVHRDVKPSNIIVARDELGLRPVLLDFGLVKLLDEQGVSLTSSKNMLGTPAAMAPEQIKGRKIDPRTDVYALGLLAYHMLTGAPAFGGVPGAIQIHLQEHGPRPRPSAKVDVDPALDKPIADALAPDPDKRTRSATELVDALRAIIHPTAATEREVVTFYVEGPRAAIARATEIAAAFDLVTALDAPDSLLAVAIKPLDLELLVARAKELLALGATAAIGTSRAVVGGAAVDGPALDVESWAPYPLPDGLWVSGVLHPR
jgi:serine/threonine-protein kinase|nr:serine/threonine-protein kinase [Kofleriaceae bacterium]